MVSVGVWEVVGGGGAWTASVGSGIVSGIACPPAKRSMLNCPPVWHAPPCARTHNCTWQLPSLPRMCHWRAATIPYLAYDTVLLVLLRPPYRRLLATAPPAIDGGKANKGSVAVKGGQGEGGGTDGEGSLRTMPPQRRGAQVERETEEEVTDAGRHGAVRARWAR